jgi:hypothetical protein
MSGNHADGPFEPHKAEAILNQVKIYFLKNIFNVRVKALSA